MRVLRKWHKSHHLRLQRYMSILRDKKALFGSLGLGGPLYHKPMAQSWAVVLFRTIYPPVGMSASTFPTRKQALRCLVAHKRESVNGGEALTSARTSSRREMASGWARGRLS